MNKTEILDRLDIAGYYTKELPSAKANGNELLALCPFHDDSNPSLSANIQTGLFNCFGCNTKGSIFDFHMKKNECDFNTALNDLAREAGINGDKQTKRKIAKTYDYTDESGNLLFQTVRYQPKDFKQRRPDGKGGWIWNLKDIKLVPYNLQEVLQAGSVLIVEGEKDVETLRDLNIIASCNPLGAGKWKAEFNQYFKGQYVSVIADNDEAGRNHALDIAKSIKGIAESVKIIELPGLQEKGDVTDWLKSGHTKYELLALCEGAGEFDCHISGDYQHDARTQHDIAFPDIYTGVAADYTELISEYLEVPAHFNFMAYLTCLGSIVSDTLSLKSSINPQPRFFTLILGESGDTRKSTAIKSAVQHFQKNLTEFNICWGVGSAEGLQKKLTNKNKLLLCFDEFKQFVSKCRIDGSVLLPCVTTLFENNFYESQTKTTSIELDNVYLSILAASTVETYQTTWDASFTDIGFTNRLFLVPGEGERKYSVPPDIPEDKTGELWKLSAAVLSFIRTNPQIDLEPDAQERFHEWYMTREPSIYAKRLDTYALRTMPLFAAINLQNTIDLDIVERVIKLMNWQLLMRKLYSPIDADNKMAQIEERIRRNLRMKPLTERELKRNIHADRCGEFYFSHAKANLLRSKDVYYNNTTKKYHLGVSV